MADKVLSLIASLRKFSEDREWDQFHSPKNLACALSVEVAELLENFQWLTEEESRTLSVERRARVAEEMADVFLYLLSLSDKLGVDLMAAAQEKLLSNSEKYPVEKSRGTSKKYTEL